eukprot:3830969-Alexandrium_andersonii.AAC.1
MLGIRGALQFGSVAPPEASFGGRLPPVGNAFELDRFLGQRFGPPIPPGSVQPPATAPPAPAPGSSQSLPAVAQCDPCSEKRGPRDSGTHTAAAQPLSDVGRFAFAG